MVDLKVMLIIGLDTVNLQTAKIFGVLVDRENRG